MHPVVVKFPFDGEMLAVPAVAPQGMIVAKSRGLVMTAIEILLVTQPPPPGIALASFGTATSMLAIIGDKRTVFLLIFFPISRMAWHFITVASLLRIIFYAVCVKLALSFILPRFFNVFFIYL